MSAGPEIEPGNTGPTGSPWAGPTVRAEEAGDAPPVEVNRTVRDAEPIEEARYEPVAGAAKANRPGRKALIGGLALSAALHAAALVFFLGELTRSGLEAETEEAVSVEIVVDAPPQPTLAGAGSGGAGTISADVEEEAVQVEEKTAAVGDPAATAEQPPEERAEFEPPTEEMKSEQAASGDDPGESEPAEPRFIPPAPDPLHLQALASPPPIPVEPRIEAADEPQASGSVEQPRARDDLIAPPPSAEPPPPPSETEAAPPEIAGLPPDVSLPSETEVPIPIPRPAAEEARQPESKTAEEARRLNKAESAVNKAVPWESRASRTAETRSAETAKQEQAKIARAGPARTGKKAAKSKRESVSAAGAAGALGGSSAGAEAKYARTLNSHIQRYKRYPEAAARRKITGVTRLAITIDRSGRLSAARVAGGSGHSALDEEALAVARRAAPYPPPPDGVGKSTFAFMVTLRFKP